MKNQTFYSIFLFIITLTLSTLAQAVPITGPYVGLQLGYGRTHYSTAHLTYSKLNNTQGIAGRAFLGYQFTPIWAAELGYGYFDKVPGKGPDGIHSGHAMTQAVDLMGKALLPFNYGFDAYGKLGIAYVDTDTSGAIKGGSHRFSPAFALGANYDITPRVPLDLSWTRIQRVTGNTPSIDLIALGIGYRFDVPMS